MGEVKSLEEIRNQIGEDRAKDGQAALEGGRPEAEGQCVAEIWLMPNGQVQVRCEPPKRFLVRRALVMSLENMRDELLREFLEQRIADGEKRIIETVKGLLDGKQESRIWTPGGQP